MNIPKEKKQTQSVPLSMSKWKNEEDVTKTILLQNRKLSQIDLFEDTASNLAIYNRQFECKSEDKSGPFESRKEH